MQSWGVYNIWNLARFMAPVLVSAGLYAVAGFRGWQIQASTRMVHIVFIPVVVVCLLLSWDAIRGYVAMRDAPRWILGDINLVRCLLASLGWAAIARFFHRRRSRPT